MRTNGDEDRCTRKCLFFKGFRALCGRLRTLWNGLEQPSWCPWPALNQIVCALRFFYGVTLGHDAIPERISYARQPSKLPVVLSADEVVRFLEAIPSLKNRTALTTVYAAGLRVSEVVLLKIADIDRYPPVFRAIIGSFVAPGRQARADARIPRAPSGG
jgi:integrase